MRTILNAVLLSGFLLLAGVLPAAAQTRPTSAPAAPHPAELAGGGAQTCLKCHSTDAKVVPILQTPHAVKGDPHSPFGQEGCESVPRPERRPCCKPVQRAECGVQGSGDLAGGGAQPAMPDLPSIRPADELAGQPARAQ